jgi:hypothetical protein
MATHRNCGQRWTPKVILHKGLRSLGRAAAVMGVSWRTSGVAGASSLKPKTGENERHLFPKKLEPQRTQRTQRKTPKENGRSGW